MWLDDGMLPHLRGLMDLPGDDDNPVHEVVRREGLKQVDSLMMVLDKTFSAAGAVSGMLPGPVAADTTAG